MLCLLRLQLETLKRDVDVKRGVLETWAKTAYGEVRGLVGRRGVSHGEATGQMEV